MVPSDAVVVGLEDTTTLGADVNDAVGIAMGVLLVVINDGSGLTTHVVRTHVDPIQRVAVGLLRSRSLHGLEHVGGVDQASLLVSAETAHIAFRIVGLLARDIVSALVSDN